MFPILESVALLSVLGVLVLLVGILWRMRDDSAPESDVSSESHEIRQMDDDGSSGRRLRRRRGGLAQLRAAAAETTAPTVETVTDHDRNDQGETADDAAVEATEGSARPQVSVRMGRKKEAHREAKRAAREAREAAVAAQRERIEKAEEARAAELEAEAAAAAVSAESARAEAEAHAAAEEAEYAEWKGLISVEESGAEHDGRGGGDDDNDDDWGGLLGKFISYVTENKVIVLEELAAEFGLRTEDAIQRLTALEENGTLSGVFDDRGKFIHVTREEMESVAQYIRRRGRVSIADLAIECTRLLHLDTAAGILSTEAAVVEPVDAN